jgi:hypothetical protein
MPVTETAVPCADVVTGSDPFSYPKEMAMRMRVCSLLTCLALGAHVGNAHAAVTFVGLFSGSDNADALETILGIPSISLLGSVDEFPLFGTDGSLTVYTYTIPSGFSQANEGEWSTTQPIGWLAVSGGPTSCAGDSHCRSGSLTGTATSKFEDAFALYAYSGETYGYYSGAKFITDSGYSEVHHIAAYAVSEVPLPGALLLFASAAAGLAGLAWRRLTAGESMTPTIST